MTCTCNIRELCMCTDIRAHSEGAETQVRPR
jgi:hypothetical protein